MGLEGRTAYLLMNKDETFVGAHANNNCLNLGVALSISKHLYSLSCMLLEYGTFNLQS